MGQVFRNLGLYGSAEPLLTDSLATLRRVSGPDHPETLAAMRELAIIYYYQARFDDAEKLFRESLEGRRGPRAGRSRDAGIMNALANLYTQMDRASEA